MNRTLILLFLLTASLSALGGDIIVNDGESLQAALRQAREWRRLHDPRCDGGISAV